MTTNIVREFVQQTLAEQGLEVSEVVESILLRNGEYAGRRFCFDGASAVWLAGADEVRFYDQSGQMKSLPLLRRAA